MVGKTHKPSTSKKKPTKVPVDVAPKITKKKPAKPAQGKKVADRKKTTRKGKK